MEKTPDEIFSCEIKADKLVKLGSNKSLVDWLQAKGIPVQGALTQITPAPGFEIVISPTSKEGVQKISWRKSPPKPLDEFADIQHLRQMASNLWSLLNDITLVPTELDSNELEGYTRFYEAALKIAAARNEILTLEPCDEPGRSGKLFVTPPQS